MSEYERELNYVRTMLKRSYDSNSLNHAKRLKRGFYDKYIILISPTDLSFIKLREELDALEADVTRKLTSLRLL